MKSSNKLKNLRSEDLSTFISLHTKYSDVTSDATEILGQINELEEELNNLTAEVTKMNEIEADLYNRISEENGMEVESVKTAVVEIMMNLKESEL